MRKRVKMTVKIPKNFVRRNIKDMYKIERFKFIRKLFIVQSKNVLIKKVRKKK